MKKTRVLLSAGAFLLAASPIALTAAFASPPASASPQQAEAHIRQVAAALSPEHGRVPIGEAHATLNLGDQYDYYGRDDARKILVDIWGNPPDAVSNVLGLVMPAGRSPLSDAWGAVITYEASGYVSDDDANSTDYAELLQQIQDGEADRNAERASAGYPAMHLVGWAETPTYSASNHSMIWAQNLHSAGDQANSLNYDVRLLGRSGVLSLNLVSTMNKLPEVKAAAAQFVTHAAFDRGATYADFNEATDEVAEYGVGGLVAAGVGLGIAKKLGFLAILAKFGKVIFIGAIALFVAFRNKVMGLFGRRPAIADDGWDEDETPPPA